MDDYKYFLTIVDDYSSLTWVFLLKSKPDVKQTVLNFIKMVANHFGRTVKTFRSDNGTEFQLQDICNKEGIIHQFSCVETSEQNARVERKHQHILSVARALLLQSSVPKYLWSYAILQAVIFINRMPSLVLQKCSTYQLLYNTLPDLGVLKVFGSLCYATSLTSGRTKFDSRARKGIFLAFQSHTKGVVIYDISSKNIFVSRQVVHHETIFPYHAPTSSHQCWDLSSTKNHPTPSIIAPPTATVTDPATSITPAASLPSPTNQTDPPPLSSDHSASIPCQSDRPHKPPMHLQDYICNQTTTSCAYPIHQYLSYDCL